MKFKYKLVCTLLLFLCSEGYAQDSSTKELANKYSNIYGWLSIIFETNDGLDKRCNTSLKSLEMLAETDFLLRNKTGYSYFEWSTKLADSEFQNRKVKESVDNVLLNIGSCDERRLQLINEQSSIEVKQLILELRMLNELYVLKKIIRNDEDVIKEYEVKLKNYQYLPFDEVQELVNSLEFGNYSYAMFSPMVKVRTDFEKALMLRAYIKNQKENK